MIGVGVGINKGLSNRKMIGGLVSVADFAWKVAGSTVENPHKAMIKSGNALIVPSSFTTEFDATGYGFVNSLNGSSYTYSNIASGNMAQTLLSFNLIAHTERKHGGIPGSTTAEKVDWLENNISKILSNIWVFGSSPSGNKATFVYWNGTTWYDVNGYWSNTTNVPSKLTMTFIDKSLIAPLIDSNGFAHFMVFSQPSNGVTASTINTDYINLEITYKNGAYVL